jgi:hypothetical protein
MPHVLRGGMQPASKGIERARRDGVWDHRIERRSIKQLDKLTKRH